MWGAETSTDEKTCHILAEYSFLIIDKIVFTVFQNTEKLRNKRIHDQIVSRCVGVGGECKLTTMELICILF